jgi:catechol 2,3-dioxygenase-like lactoylglutathione lyase family enzyme
MPQEEVLEGKEKEIVQVGVVVKDLEKTVEYLTALGLGPFSIRTVTHPSATVHGEKVFYEVRLAKSQQGPVELELIENQKGKTIHKEFLDEKGEGLHHVKFTVRDFDATLDKFARKGIGILQMDKPVGGGGMAYLETTKIGGLMIEISQRPPNYDPKEGVKYK